MIKYLSGLVALIGATLAFASPAQALCTVGADSTGPVGNTDHATCYTPSSNYLHLWGAENFLLDTASYYHNNPMDTQSALFLGTPVDVCTHYNVFSGLWAACTPGLPLNGYSGSNSTYRVADNHVHACVYSWYGYNTNGFQRRYVFICGEVWGSDNSPYFNATIPYVAGLSTY